MPARGAGSGGSRGGRTRRVPPLKFGNSLKILKVYPKFFRLAFGARKLFDFWLEFWGAPPLNPKAGSAPENVVETCFPAT